MISYITAVAKDENEFKINLKASWKKIGSSELVEIRNAVSIADAYNRGAKEAKFQIKCFLHQDVIILNPERFEAALIQYCTQDVGIVGVIGTLDSNVIPWWNGNKIGCVVDPLFGLLNFGEQGGFCALLDGLMLATAQDVTFDGRYAGFHIYDCDICSQMLAKGLKNYCMPLGYQLIMHNTSRKGNPLGDDWYGGIEKYKTKWGLK